MGQLKEALKLVRDCKVIDYKVLWNSTAYTPAGRLDKEALMILKLCAWKYVDEYRNDPIKIGG